MLLKFDVQCAMVLDFSAKLVEMPVILACLAVKMSDACAIRPDSGLMCSADYRPCPISRDPEPRRGFHAADRRRSEGSGRAKACLRKEPNQLKSAGIR